MPDRVSRSGLIDCIDINHGPPELLTRFFFKAEQEASRIGVTLELGSFPELIQANEENKDSWAPLTTAFRHDLGGINDDNGIVVFGRDRTGRIIATYSVRHFDWSKTDFATEAEALRLFYANPERDKRKGETCRVTAPQGRNLNGYCLYTGALWIHPDFRRLELSTILPWTSRAVGCTRWPIDNSFAIIGDYSLAKGLDWKVGYTEDNVFNGVHLFNNASLPDRDVEFALCVIPRDYLMDGLFRFVTEFSIEDRAAVNNRTA